MRRLLLFILFLPQLTFSQYYAKCFSLNSDATQILLGTTVSQDSVIALNINTEVSALSISGCANLGDDENSYIRVTLKDSYDYEYLIYENYHMLSTNQTETFYNTAIETMALNNIIPQSIKVEVCNAFLRIDKLSYFTTVAQAKMSSQELAVIQKEQQQYIVNRLNANLEEHGKTWRAGLTSVAEKSYEEKKDMFGGALPELYGFEYYTDGIFIMPDEENDYHNIIAEANNLYVNEWDWRNRHGRNWMTTVKYQGICGSCWAFSGIGTLEAYINLYYNQLLNYDLSEQEVISCTGYGCGAANRIYAINYFENNGISEESCFPYQATMLECEQKCQTPTERIYLESHGSIIKDEYELKQHLFKAPISLGIGTWGHAVVLVGYKTIEIGDTIYMNNNNPILINEEDHYNLLGKTAWIIKNSWGTNWGKEGYGYFVVSNINSLNIPYYLDGKIMSLVYNDSDIVCEDRDGDGYYFWGIGPKPSSCPSWVPDTPDGDDSDPYFGPIDEYGNLTLLECNDTINASTIYTGSDVLFCKLVITNHSSLTINGTLLLTKNAKIKVCEGSSLIVDGGTIQKANIEMIPGSSLLIRNNGIINMADDIDFNVSAGTSLIIENGEIRHGT